ncbi:Ubiquitin-like protein ATG12 [Microtus ochrogaster]|uniref:Ubiquitin-like protein ATG12 n=1 Tax=Microtus ochrogaster TaxID=79684 RepID=A0A8J6GPD0_MICOH|nr:Ubiquitin-like protein ATG12 [Microtus ochrogaster]
MYRSSDIPKFTVVPGSPTRRLLCDPPWSKAQPLHRVRHFRHPLSASKMAEDPEALLQLPPSAAAAGGESLSELSPETATPEPPSSATVSPGTEEPPGDTKKKSNVNIHLCAEAGDVIEFVREAARKEAKAGEGCVPEVLFLLLPVFSPFGCLRDPGGTRIRHPSHFFRGLGGSQPSSSLKLGCE